MAKIIKKPYANGQPVVFQFGDRNLVGTVVNWKLANKQYYFDVLAENGKLYEDLPVDADYKLTINSAFTELFYKKYNINAEEIVETVVIEDEDEIEYSDVVVDSNGEIDDDVIDELAKLGDSYMYDEENPEFE